MPSPDLMDGRQQYYQMLQEVDSKVLEKKPDLWGGTAQEYRFDLNLDSELSLLPRGGVIYDAGSFQTAKGVDQLHDHFKHLDFVAVNHSFMHLRGRSPRIRTISSPIEEMDYKLRSILEPQGMFPADVVMCRKVLNMIVAEILELNAPPQLIDWAMCGLVDSIKPNSGKVLIYEAYDGSIWQEEIYRYYQTNIAQIRPDIKVEVLSNPAGNSYMRLSHK